MKTLTIRLIAALCAALASCQTKQPVPIYDYNDLPDAFERHGDPDALPFAPDGWELRRIE